MSQIVLGIDYGTQRIGVAIARGPLAEPLQILPGGEGAVARLAALCEREQVEQLVFGVSENDMAEQTRSFAKEVAAATSLPVEYVDETLSSKEMRHRLRSGPMKQTKREGHIDHFVAAQLLQDWLDL